MKYFYLILSILVIMTAAAVPCTADIDPILLNEPNDAVFECGDDIFVEFLSEPMLTPTLSGRRAVNNFLFFRMEMLFLADASWNGIDKTSFSVKHTAPDGTEEIYPLDYASTMIGNLKQDLKTLSDTISTTSLFYYNLVFDVNETDRDGWSFLFQPKERGEQTAFCEIEIPLTVR